jgi:hypothetical protein
MMNRKSGPAVASVARRPEPNQLDTLSAPLPGLVAGQLVHICEPVFESCITGRSSAPGNSGFFPIAGGRSLPQTVG